MIQFTEAAVNHLKTALDPGDVVRVGVLGGGCSGMSYSLSIETEFDEEARRAFFPSNYPKA